MTPATTMDEVFDSTRAKITVEKKTDSTSFTIRLNGIDPSVADATFATHLHTGPCVEGNPGSAGPHYNHQVVVDGKAFPKFGENTQRYDRGSQPRYRGLVRSRT
jgi:hypothetical protein